MKCPWHDRLVLLSGIWLFAAPFALGVPSLTHPAVVAAYVCGAVLVSSAAQAPAIPDLIEEWIGYKTRKEVDAIRLRPHPYEFVLYHDI